MTNGVCQAYCNNLGFAYSGTEYSSECYCSNTAPTVSSTACTMTCSNAGSTDICGGPNALSVSFNANLAAAAAQNAALVASWTNQGCYGDNYPTRIIAAASTTASGMTVETCVSFCNTGGYSVAGVEYSTECYCANSILTDGSTYGTTGQTGCTFACGGNANEVCGGSNYLNVYSKGKTVSTTTPVATTSSTSSTSTSSTSSAAAYTPLPTAASGYTFKGCYLDNSSRTLATQMSNANSVEACISSCSTAGFTYAGLEYYGECYCANTIGNGATLIDSKNCNYACTGTPSETCGGSFAIQIYAGTPAAASKPTISIPQTANGYNYVDTFTDTGARPLAVTMSLSSTTVESCVTACSSAGYTYAGLEYAAECYCGSAILNNPSGGVVPTMACQGNSAEYCGGPNAMQIYRGTPNTPHLTSPFTNGACATDNANNVRILTGAYYTSPTLTPASCKVLCQGFTYYGVEYSNECYCGNSFPASTLLSSGCNMPCAGDSTQTCGGSNALNIYNS
jgi:hypothetical protein